MRLAALAAPLAIPLIAGGCKAAAPPAESFVCKGVPHMAMQGQVTDAADILSEAEETRLSDRLAKYEQRTKHQMVVATTTSLNGVRVDDFGTCLGKRWAVDARITTTASSSWWRPRSGRCGLPPAPEWKRH